MKKIIFALVLGFSLSGAALACTEEPCKTQTQAPNEISHKDLVAHSDGEPDGDTPPPCSEEPCKTQTQTPNEISHKNLIACGTEDCNRLPPSDIRPKCDLGDNCKTQPTIPAVIACEDWGCKTQTHTPNKISHKNLIAQSDGEPDGDTPPPCTEEPCKTQPATPPVVGCGTEDCRAQDVIPTVPSLKGAKMVACQEEPCKTQATTSNEISHKNLIAYSNGGPEDDTPPPSCSDDNCRAQDVIPAVPSLKDAKMVACDGDNC